MPAEQLTANSSDHGDTAFFTKSLNTSIGFGHVSSGSLQLRKRRRRPPR